MDALDFYRILYYTYHIIQTKELSDISHALTINSTLKSLSLSNNSFSLASIRASYSCLKVNKSLHNFTLLPNNHSSCSDDMVCIYSLKYTKILNRVIATTNTMHLSYYVPLKMEFAVILNSIEELLRTNRLEHSS